MDLADRTIMLLGGSGLVGHAVARRVLAANPPPRRLVLVALFEDEVRAAARALYESYLCRQLCPDVRALAASKPAALAEAAWRLLETDAALRQQIISVGLPIVAPDGKNVYRGRSLPSRIGGRESNADGD